MLTHSALTVFLLLFAGCASMPEGGYSISGAGSTEGDALVSVGKIVSPQAEIGITGLAANVEEDHASYAVGPYAAWLVPMDQIAPRIGDDWQPWLGGGILCVMESGDFGLVPRAVAGVVYQPKSALSPYLMAEKAWPTGDINTVDLGARDDVYGWAGVRYNF